MIRFLRALVPAATFAFVCVATICGRADAIVYHGAPDLPLTSALVAAGGGPSHFSSFKLFKLVAGRATDAEAKKLTDQFGAADVKTTFAIFDFAVNDTIAVATARHIALPAPEPNPKNGKALAIALYRAGVTQDGRWDVGYMLEHLITHPIHHVIMNDIDAKFGKDNNAVFHIALDQMMHDLAMAYSPHPR
jgi:hypothetical protein